jgi:hypothetical protein
MKEKIPLKKPYAKAKFEPKTKFDILRHIFFNQVYPMIIGNYYMAQVYFFNKRECIEFYNNYQYIITYRIGEIFGFDSIAQDTIIE